LLCNILKFIAVYCCIFWQFEFVYRWHQTTLSDPLEAAKTAWPVPYVEAIFLPEFKIKGDVTGKDFQVLLFLYLIFLIFILFEEDFVGRQGPKMYCSAGE
jgi:hypothetical protein